MSFLGSFARRPFYRLLLLVVGLVVLFNLKSLVVVSVQQTDTSASLHKSENAASDLDIPSGCESYAWRFLTDIQVVLKIGKAEDTDKILAHLETVTSCVPNLLIFSDAPGQVGKHEVIDALADLPASYRDNADFAAYDSIRKSQAAAGAPSWDGWKLDRFKWLPMVERTVKERPNASWYIFLEADTYVFWESMLQFLDQLHSSDLHYIGSPIQGTEGRFYAHGGTGVVLSEAAVRLFIEAPPGRHKHIHGQSITRTFQRMVKDECCGDVILGYALAERGIMLNGYWPMFNGHNTEQLGIKEDTFCTPLVSLHHVSGHEMRALWKWRSTANSERVMIHSDIFSFLHGDLVPRRPDWDNFGRIRAATGKAHSSVEACAQLCKNAEQCLQYSYSGIAGCFMDSSVRLGHHIDHADTELWSGWEVSRIAQMATSECPETVSWLSPSLERRL